MINELDRVVLRADLPDQGLTVGDVGTVVMDHQGGTGCIVEFLTLAGETVAVVTLNAEQVRALQPNDRTHARLLASA